MKTFKNTKDAENKVKILLKELEIIVYGLRIKPFNLKTYFIDIDINQTSLYGVQCISELLGDSNPTITPINRYTISIGSIFKIQ